MSIMSIGSQGSIPYILVCMFKSIPSQREGLDAVYILSWKSTTWGSSTFHLVGIPCSLLEDCIMLSSGVEIIFTPDNVNTH